jgi:predicted ester cyclase
MKTDTNKTLVHRWFQEVWNEGRESTIDELYAPDGVSFGLGGSDTEVRGPEQFKVFFRNLRCALPDTHITLVDTIAEGDKVVVRFEVQATHTGSGLPVEPTGRRVRFSGMSIIEVVDGKLTKGWNNWDQLGMLIQLGVISESASADKMLEPSTGQSIGESAA